MGADQTGDAGAVDSGSVGARLGCARRVSRLGVLRGFASSRRASGSAASGRLCDGIRRRKSGVDQGVVGTRSCGRSCRQGHAGEHPAVWVRSYGHGLVGSDGATGPQCVALRAFSRSGPSGAWAGLSVGSGVRPCDGAGPCRHRSVLRAPSGAGPGLSERLGQVHRWIVARAAVAGVPAGAVRSSKPLWLVRSVWRGEQKRRRSFTGFLLTP